MDADEERSFRDFVAARGPALMRLGYLLTGGDQHAAEDLVQSALSRAVPRWSRIETPEAYVRQAMYRHQVSWWRRPSNRNERAHPHDDLPESPTPDQTGTVRSTAHRSLALLRERTPALTDLTLPEEVAR